MTVVVRCLVAGPWREKWLVFAADWWTDRRRMLFRIYFMNLKAIKVNHNIR